MIFKQKHNVAFLIILAILLALSINAEPQNELEKGIELFKANKLTEAKISFEAYIKEHPDNPTAAIYLGRIYMNERNYDRSIDWFKKAVEINENSSESHHWLGRAYGQKAQKSSMFKQAFLARKVRQEFEKAVELDSTNIDAKFDLIQYYIMAPGFMGGSKEKAWKLARQIKMFDTLKGHQAFALIYQSNEKYDQAENEYLAAIREDPQNTNLQFNLGLFQVHVKKYDNALETFENILKNNNEYLNACYQIGKIGAISGKNHDRAEQCLKKYLQNKPAENSPSLAWAHYRLGMVYENKVRKDLARHEYKAALKLDAEHEKAKKALEKIE